MTAADAQRAYEVGLVTEVVPRVQLMERARELAGLPGELMADDPLAAARGEDSLGRDHSAQVFRRGFNAREDDLLPFG